MHFKIMKTKNRCTEMQAGVMRAGVISLLSFALCGLWLSGIADTLRAWLFIVSFAVCFVLMVLSIVDLLVLAFTSAASFSGKALGWLVKVVRGVFSHPANAA
jgi:hypothetical protein